AAAIARFQGAEVERTGIPSLKVGFNKVFGYYIEITHAQAAQAEIPAHYVRKQTLSTAERYITDELKQLETSILTAEEKSRALEGELFLELRAAATKRGDDVRRLARALARVDVLAGFAQLARARGWVRPEVDDGPVIDVKDGRHPVLDVRLPAGELVPNDVHLDRDTARLVLITGPNMAGKSTYIRQTALLVLLAQIGSFVPAASARIGVVDRIFTRVGASDDLSAGSSTFMVEMTETAAILNGATERSLVILDEVGRGTSTWDGLSLAWAISEYLYKKIGARTLFATHYHELVDLADEFPAVRNVNVSVREWGDEIVFLHKIVPGGTDRSYGLHVARLAGVPGPVIERARRILADLEQSAPDLRPNAGAAAGAEEPEPLQRPLFPKPVASIVDELRALDVEQVTPMDALLLLASFVRRLDAPDEGDGA
ncbi:MAG: DNA mismatch repair protein MutS, partial [Planctomycetes bacterium]|nr:DNA mismatch repair protein MutS [Planctomycetota bacterium]